MMPLVWVRHYTGEQGKTSKVFTTTMGAAVDLENEGLRQLLVNAAYWAAGLKIKSRPKPTWSTWANTSLAGLASASSSPG